MIPHERELMTKMAGRPFTILGINSDRSRSALKKIIAENKINYPNIYDGVPGGGEIANTWNVHGWPTIYLIDHEGVIVELSHGGPHLESKVEKLVEKAKK